MADRGADVGGELGFLAGVYEEAKEAWGEAGTDVYL
jgi:hypothetical protein